MTPAATLVVALSLAPAALDTAAPPVVERATLDDIKGLRAEFYVAATPAEVLATLWDIDRFPEMFPDIKAMQVVARQEARVDVAFTVDAVLATVSYTLRRQLDRDAGTITWRSIAGEVKSIRGSWRVERTAEEGVAKVTYSSFVDVGAFVPEAVVRDVAISKAEELAERVRAAVKAVSRPLAGREPGAH